MAQSKEVNQAQLKYSPDSRKAFDIALYISGVDDRDIGIQQLTFSVLNRLGLSNAEDILRQYASTFNDFLQNLIALATTQTILPKLEPNQKPNLDQHSIGAIRLSAFVAKEEGVSEIEPKHLLIGIVRYAEQFRQNHPPAS